MIEISVLGPLRICVDGEQREPPRLTSAALLIGLLALGNRRFARDEVLEALWPVEDEEPKSRADRLDQAVLHARAVFPERLGLDYLRRISASAIGGGKLWLKRDAALVVDRDSAHSATEHGQLQMAMRYHRGPVLQGESAVWLEPYRKAQRREIAGLLKAFGHDSAEEVVTLVLTMGGESYLRTTIAPTLGAQGGELCDAVGSLRRVVDALDASITADEYRTLDSDRREIAIREWLERRDEMERAIATLHTRLASVIDTGADNQRVTSALRLKVLSDRALQALSVARLTPFSAETSDPNWAELDHLARLVDNEYC